MVPKKSKQVQLLAPKKSKIGAYKAPFNSKKASGTWKLQKGAFSGARKSQYVREILYPTEQGILGSIQILRNHILAFSGPR